MHPLRPIPGSTLTVNLTNLPLATAFMLMGFSDTSHPPFALPLNLTPFGLTSCNLLTERRQFHASTSGRTAPVS